MIDEVGDLSHVFLFCKLQQVYFSQLKGMLNMTVNEDIHSCY